MDLYYGLVVTKQSGTQRHLTDSSRPSNNWFQRVRQRQSILTPTLIDLQLTWPVGPVKEMSGVYCRVNPTNRLDHRLVRREREVLTREREREGAVREREREEPIWPKGVSHSASWRMDNRPWRGGGGLGVVVGSHTQNFPVPFSTFPGRLNRTLVWRGEDGVRWTRVPWPSLNYTLLWRVPVLKVFRTRLYPHPRS